LQKSDTRSPQRAVGCRCGIDVHSHVVPSRFPGRDDPPDAWPSVHSVDACHGQVMIGSRPYRLVSDACWLASRRLEAMDAAGIGLQVLSPMPELFSYWMETAAADDLIRYTNDVLAALVQEGAGRFRALAGVPLQDLDRAIAELTRVMALPGFAGVEIGSNINGIPVGHSHLFPFFAEAERLGAAVFVHAVRPAGSERLVGPAPLQQVLGYPTDIGLAAASAITNNLLSRFPSLRLAFSHGGGTFAALLPRLEQGYATFPALRDSLGESPSQQARRLFVDSLVFDRDMLRQLVQIFGEDHVMIGTDYPFNFREEAPMRRIEEAFEEARLRDRLTRLNAAAFLGLNEICP
jgi:aminocarboxymuconate-semialdehyde decarboxylase